MKAKSFTELWRENQHLNFGEMHRVKGLVEDAVRQVTREKFATSSNGKAAGRASRSKLTRVN